MIAPKVSRLSQPDRKQPQSYKELEATRFAVPPIFTLFAATYRKFEPRVSEFGGIQAK